MSPLFRQAALAKHLRILIVIGLSGCCVVRPPTKSPDWITASQAPPTARACTQFDKEVQRQMRELKHKLEKERLCCGNKGECQEALRSLGSAAWDKSLSTYGLVHTNIPVGDKIDGLRENQATIDGLHVCPVRAGK